MMNTLFSLTDEQMERLKPFFPKSHGKPQVDDLRVLSGIIFIIRNGLQWCDTPREYSPSKTGHNRLPVRPRRKSVWFAANRAILVSAGEAIK